MRKITLFILLVLTAHLSYGQQTEFSIHLNSGFGAYRGDAAVSESSINEAPFGGEPRTGNPNGSKPGLSYGLAGQLQRVGKKESIWGVQGGYEILRSRVRINYFIPVAINILYPVEGSTTLANHFVNLHPYFGHRFNLRAFNLDLMAGPEVGWLHRSHEKGKAEGNINNASIRTDLNRSHPDVDVRARVNLAASYKRTSLLLGYSYGLTSYRKNYDGGSNDLYLQAFRLGLAYRI